MAVISSACCLSANLHPVPSHCQGDLISEWAWRALFCLISASPGSICTTTAELRLRATQSNPRVGGAVTISWQNAPQLNSLLPFIQDCNRPLGLLRKTKDRDLWNHCQRVVCLKWRRSGICKSTENRKVGFLRRQRTSEKALNTLEQEGINLESAHTGNKVINIIINDEARLKNHPYSLK